MAVPREVRSLFSLAPELVILLASFGGDTGVAHDTVIKAALVTVFLSPSASLTVRDTV